MCSWSSKSKHRVEVQALPHCLIISWLEISPVISTSPAKKLWPCVFLQTCSLPRTWAHKYISLSQVYDNIEQYIFCNSICLEFPQISIWFFSLIFFRSWFKCHLMREHFLNNTLHLPCPPNYLSNSCPWCHLSRTDTLCICSLLSSPLNCKRHESRTAFHPVLSLCPLEWHRKWVTWGCLGLLVS